MSQNRSASAIYNNNNVATSARARARAPALDGGSREVRFCYAHARGR